MRILLAIIISTQSLFVLSCPGKTELETIYCQLKQTPHGSSLPSYFDFKKNPEATQRLLLRRPARKAAISLPTVKSSQPQQRQKNKSNTQSSKPDRQSPKPRQNKKIHPLSDCSLKSETIQCPSGQSYKLIHNLSRNLLGKEALSQDNTLQLTKSNDYNITLATDDYHLYIIKMLKIGLGGSTMTFSKFYYTHQDVQRQGQDPQARFAQMYELLKQDRKTMAIQRRYDHRLPKSLDQCQNLSSTLIVCDQDARNWVYLRH